MICIIAQKRKVIHAFGAHFLCINLNGPFFMFDVI